MKKLLVRQGDEFLKYHGPSVEHDWRKVKTFEALTESVPGIRTARPLQLDLDRQCIVYEWLGDLPRIITLRGEARDEMIYTLGRGLAKLHLASANTVDTSVESSAAVFPLDMFCLQGDDRRKLDAKLPVAFFHGDCWHGNVHVDEDHNCVMIDPIQSPWLFGNQAFDLANGIVDLATLHMSLLVSFRIIPLMMLNVEQQLAVGDLLLEAYLTEHAAMSLRPQVLFLSRAIARKYVATYPTRINTFVGWAKLWISNRVIAEVTKRNSDQ